MDKPKQYVDAGEVRKVVDDVTRGSAILISREWINTRLLSLITTATPIPPDPRYDALRADVEKVRDDLRIAKTISNRPMEKDHRIRVAINALTAALDAVPGDAPATFPEGIPIQVDAELYYRFKGYRENDMVGEPEETFTIYVTPESSFAPPPSPTVPQVPVSVIEDAVGQMDNLRGLSRDGEYALGWSRCFDEFRLVVANAFCKCGLHLAPYRNPPPDEPERERLGVKECCGTCVYFDTKRAKPYLCAKHVMKIVWKDDYCPGYEYRKPHPIPPPDAPADEPCAVSAMEKCRALMLKRCQEGYDTLPCPDCAPATEPDGERESKCGGCGMYLSECMCKLTPAPVTPTVEQRARWWLNLTGTAPGILEHFARTLAGERNLAVTAWLREQEEATDAP